MTTPSTGLRMTTATTGRMTMPLMTMRGIRDTRRGDPQGNPIPTPTTKP